MCYAIDQTVFVSVFSLFERDVIETETVTTTTNHFAADFYLWKDWSDGDSGVSIPFQDQTVCIILSVYLVCYFFCLLWFWNTRTLRAPWQLFVLISCSFLDGTERMRHSMGYDPLLPCSCSCYITCIVVSTIFMYYYDWEWDHFINSAWNIIYSTLTISYGRQLLSPV